jgi:hypothetical protein
MKRFAIYIDGEVFQRPRFRSYVRAAEYAQSLADKLSKTVWIFHQGFKFKATAQ